jgi:4,5-dihydroxyphthalate decarboxylase
MPKLELSVAVGDYDRVRPLIDGNVTIDGVAPLFMMLEPEEVFFRAFRHAEFDIAELSLSSFTVRTARGDNPYVGVPVLLSRAFRHSGIYVRTDRGIRAPSDLKGRKVGLAEYQLTANVWIRALLDDDFGVTPEAIQWVRGGIEEPGRPEKIPICLPGGVTLTDAPAGRSLSQMLLDGEIDALIGPRTPSAMAVPGSNVGWLFPDPRAAAIEYYRRTGNFPIMHLVGVRRTLVERHPWLPAAVLKAFDRAKTAAFAKLADTSASKVMLPFLDQQLADAQALLGPDLWPYGIEANRRCLEYFLMQHHKQGLSQRPVTLPELFPPSTFETARI